MNMKNKISELIKKYDAYVDNDVKGAIDIVEYKQAAEVCDGTERYMELELLKVYFYNLYINEFKKNRLDEYIDKLDLEILNNNKVYVLLDDSVWDDEPNTKIVAVSLDKDDIDKVAIDYINKAKDDIDFDNLEITDDEDSEYVLDSDEKSNFSIYLNGYYNGNHINISIIEKDLILTKSNETENLLEY